MLSSGLATIVTPARLRIWSSLNAYASLYEPIAVAWPATTRPLHAVAHRAGRHDLKEARLLVVGLVAVEVDGCAGLLREVEQELDLLDAVLARPFVVGDAADHVAAEAHRLAHQLLAVWERQDAVLRERDQAQVHDVAHLVAQLEQRAEGRQDGIADVHVGTDEAGPLRDLPEDRLAGRGT